MSSPSRRLGGGVSTISYLVVFVFGVDEENEEAGGSPRFSTPMVESFSKDLLPTVESYWTDSHLEFCQTSTTELFMSRAVR